MNEDLRDLLVGVVAIGAMIWLLLVIVAAFTAIILSI
jgi:hypothetical protein